MFRSALGNVSNDQSTSAANYQQKTSARGTLPNHLGRSTFSEHFNLSARRRFSKSYGDASNLRPKSPPLQHPVSHPQRSQPPNNDHKGYVYNPVLQNNNRQPIPTEWRADASDASPSALVKPVQYGSPTSVSDLPLSPSIVSRQFAHQLKTRPDAIPILGIDPGPLRPSDFSIPAIRNYLKNGNQDVGSHSVEHLDVSTTWKGISFPIAEELFCIHQTFIKTLEDILSSELWQIHLRQVRQHFSANVSKSSWDLFTAGLVRGISFCSDQLAERMSDALYSSGEDNVNESFGLLRLYLASSDYLVPYPGDLSRDTSVTVCVHSYRASPLSKPVVEAMWAPDTIAFVDLNEFSREGEELRIVPKYRSNSPFRQTLTSVNYYLETPQFALPWLTWDNHSAGFRGIVPISSNIGKHIDRFGILTRSYADSVSTVMPTLQFNIKAVINHSNSLSIGFERIVRARVMIKVLPSDRENNVYCPHRLVAQPKVHADARFTHDSNADRVFAKSSDAAQGAVSKSKTLRVDTGINKNFDIESRGRPNSRLNYLVTTTGFVEKESFELAQIHARLAKQYADLAGRHAEAKEQVTHPDSFRGLALASKQAVGPQMMSVNSYPVTSRDVNCNPPVAGHELEHLTTPPSPVLSGRKAILSKSRHVADQREINTTFTPLPPPALVPNASARMTHEPLVTHMENTAPYLNKESSNFRSDIGPESHLQLNRCPRRLPEQAPYARPYLEESWSQSVGDESSDGDRLPVSPSTTIIRDQDGRSPISSERCSNKRRAESSITDSSPSKRPKEGKRNSQPRDGSIGTSPCGTLGRCQTCSSTQNSPIVDHNSISSLRNPCTFSIRSNEYEEDNMTHETFGNGAKGGTTTDGMSAQSKRRLCSYYMNEDAGLSDLDGLLAHIDVGSSKALQKFQSGDCLSLLPANQGSPESMSGNPVPITPRAPATKEIFPHAGQTVPQSQPPSSKSFKTDSRIPSTETEIIVEHDPHLRRTSRREQAILWKLATEADRKGHQPETDAREARLTDDERKAMDEAMKRSLEELAGVFDDIFIHDSADSSCGVADDI